VARLFPRSGRVEERVPFPGTFKSRESSCHVKESHTKDINEQSAVSV
jgi:hypothetical protein